MEEFARWRLCARAAGVTTTVNKLSTRRNGQMLGGVSGLHGSARRAVKSEAMVRSMSRAEMRV